LGRKGRPALVRLRPVQTQYGRVRVQAPLEYDHARTALRNHSGAPERTAELHADEFALPPGDPIVEPHPALGDAATRPQNREAVPVERNAMRTLTLLSLVLLSVYPFVIFPAVLAFWARRKGVRPVSRPDIDSPDSLPRVALVICALNEQSIIREKVENSLA